MLQMCKDLFDKRANFIGSAIGEDDSGSGGIPNFWIEAMQVRLSGSSAGMHRCLHVLVSQSGGAKNRAIQQRHREGVGKIMSG